MRKWEMDSIPLDEQDTFLMKRVALLSKHEKGLKETLRGIEERIKILKRQKDELTLAILQLTGERFQAEILLTDGVPQKGDCDAVH